MEDAIFRPQGSDGATRGRARILLVEDEPSARAALAELLALEGYEVAAAVDGEEALARLRVFLPDLVLTDLQMPRLDGFALIDRLAAILPGVPVIVMTAFTPLGRLDRHPPAVAATLIKPVELAQVLASIERALGRGRRDPL